MLERNKNKILGCNLLELYRTALMARQCNKKDGMQFVLLLDGRKEHRSLWFID